MRKLIVLVVLSLCVWGVSAQNGHVEQLSEVDAKEALAKWNALQKATNDWSQFQARIGSKYLNAGKDGATGCSNGFPVKQGWGCGEFEFTPDMKFITPKVQPFQSVTPWNGSCFVAHPATLLN